MTQHDDPIRLRPDGSIDIAYYTQRGRVMRSEQAHRMLRGTTPSAPRRYRQGLWGFFPRVVS